jgi:hypothetical protein
VKALSDERLDRTAINLNMSHMSDMKPCPLSEEDWKQVIAIPAVREAWGLQDDVTPSEFAASVYGVKFKFVSGSPGYFGDLFILQGDALTGDPPMVLRRGDDGALLVS